MSKLSDFLVESILNEDTPKQVVALFGGGFKPPTKGHLEVIINGLNQNPEINKLKIIVGGGERDGMTQDQSVKIWEFYTNLNLIPLSNVEIIKSNPFTYYKDYLRKNPEDKVYVFIGSRENNDKDQLDVDERSKFIKKYSNNVIPVEVSTGGSVSGTEARKLFKTDIDAFKTMLPSTLLDRDVEHIIDILNNNEKSTPKPESNKTEPLKPINEDIIDKTDFVLPRGKKMILQAEDEDYNRGLIVELTEEGGYKMNYWYGEDAKVYPVEVLVDGESIKPDANEVYMKFHPELEKEPLNENATYSSKIDYKQQIIDLTKHMLDKGMNIKPLPKVIFKHGDQENASQFLGKTAYYSPDTQEIVLYTEGRHPKDIARSFAHEMIHHIQNLEGRLGGINTTNTTQDDNLNDIEREAYTKGNMTFRNWTDNKDGEEVTSLNEGPQFGVLYHFTEYLLDVLDDNMLRGPISLTRSRDSFVKDWIGSVPILVLDKDKLRNNYKIRPYQSYDDDGGSEDEMEEVIDRDITNLNKYIIKVILPKPNEEYENTLKEKGISYEIDKQLNEIGDASSKIFNYKKIEGPKPDFFRRVVDANKEDVDFNVIYEFETDLGTLYKVELECEYYSLSMNRDYGVKGGTGDDLEVEINFYADGDQRMTSTNKGEQYSVMATITDIIINWINEWDKYFYINYIWIEPKVENDEEDKDAINSQRGRLYKAYLEKSLSKLNKDYKIYQKTDAFKILPTFENPSIPKKVNEKTKDPFGLNQFARELMGETKKPTTEHLEEQEEVRIFTTNCGCDKAKRTI
jgi:phosphopantetheine adenylyltransferase